jgi:hypothetical protein
MHYASTFESDLAGGRLVVFFLTQPLFEAGLNIASPFRLVLISRENKKLLSSQVKISGLFGDSAFPKKNYLMLIQQGMLYNGPFLKSKRKSIL